MLDKDVLGLARYNAEVAFNNKTKDELIDAHGSIENARLAFLKADSEMIINHFKTSGELIVPGTGLAAPNGPVTGSSTTGHIQ